MNLLLTAPCNLDFYHRTKQSVLQFIYFRMSVNWKLRKYLMAENCSVNQNWNTIPSSIYFPYK